MRITRLAPFPTGALHLGNARTFLVNWLLARQNGWKIQLRIEDLDGPRIKRGAAQQLIEDLQWLGIDWDQGPSYQSARLPLYQNAIRQLLEQGWAYPCVCSRKEVESAASAPHAEDGAAVYPGTCRDRYRSMEQARERSGREPALRFRVPPQIVEFDDVVSGRQEFDVLQKLGDFVIAKSDGTPAYQLAVVVDDAQMNVTDIVRGDDLLDSTPRQILIYRSLGLEKKVPNYYHLPLITGQDGRRLAKRHGDTRLSSYRQCGIPSSRILALLARWSAIPDAPELSSVHDLLSRFRLDSMPKDRIIFSPADDRWLRAGASES